MAKRQSTLTALEVPRRPAEQQGQGGGHGDAMYRAFVEFSTEGIWYFDLTVPMSVALPEFEQVQHLLEHCRLRECNASMMRLMGAERREDLLGRPLSSFLSADSADDVEHLLRFIRSDYKLAAEEYRRCDKQGQPRFFINSFSGELKNGYLYGAWGTMQDITRLKEVEGALMESESRYRVLAESSPLGIWHIDLNGYTLYANPTMCNLLGAQSQAGLVGISYQEFFDESGIEIIQRERDKRAKGEASDYEVVLYDLRGKLHDVLIAGAPVVDKQGRLTSLIGTFVDVTERKHIEKNLHVAANALENMVEGLVIQDAEFCIVQVNHSFGAITGYTAEEVLGRPVGLLYASRNDERFRQRLHNIVRRRGHWRGEVQLRRKDGELYPALLSVSAVYDAKKRLVHYVSVFSDISQYKHYERQLTHIAHHDGLTGLPNRVFLEDRIRAAIKRARRNGSLFAVLFIDLDDFKTINDSLGHTAGDELLKQVAQRLKESVREEDTIARLGGDEFIVLLEGLKDADDAAQIANKLLAALAEPVRHASRELFTGASIGISTYPESGTDLATLMKNADAAMYEAKESGRNTYKHFSGEMNAGAWQNLILANDLRSALERDEFTLQYQPFVNLETNEVSAVEALLRWNHPRLGLTKPGYFIGFAEQTGAINQIGDWVLNAALRQFRAWQDEGKQPGRLSVNLSARQFSRPDLLEKLIPVLENAGVSPHQLIIEITETLLVKQPEQTGRLLAQFSALGIQVAIDDFGTGYSSLSYLKHFPINLLKIDQSFIQGLPGDPDDAAITRAIIAMASGLGIRVIAEGVETDAQRQFLLGEGCEMAQGHLFQRPTDPATLASILR